MKLFLVTIGYGIWIVRAENAVSAEDLARHENGEESNALSYGHIDSEPATVDELEAEGMPGIVGHHHTFEKYG